MTLAKPCTLQPGTNIAKIQSPVVQHIKLKAPNMQILDQGSNPTSKVKSTLRSDSFYSSEYSNTNYMVSKNFSPRNNKVEIPA